MTDQSTDTPDLDAIVIGAGMSGLYMLHRLRDTLGMRALVVERADDVGGTWYWNRYPGARCDSESYFYSFSDRLSEDLLQEWTWSERFAGQPEILRYLQHVAERFDLRRDIRFGTTVTAATWDEDGTRWLVDTDDGRRTSARHLITAVGCLSTTNLPEFPGRDSFAGESFHTGAWPHEGVDFTGRRVAVIGTGATAVQAVPEIAAQAEHVHVLQRTPNYDIAGGNRPMTEQDAREIKENYTDIWARTRETGFGFPYDAPERTALSVGDEERRQIFEEAWQRGGFRLGTTFNDLLLDEAANDTASEFLREKIRERVHDPAVAELLCPSDHPFFTKRPPLENGWYETFNRSNVTLVDVRSNPIEQIVPTGVRTAEAQYDVDTIVYATGFDAMTGTLFKLGIRGADGVPLAERWADGPRTYLGVAATGFPNLFMITGPQSPSVLSNMPVSIEQHVDWITDLLRHLQENGQDRIEPSEEAEQGWIDHHDEVSAATLLPRANSWWVGANIPGKPRRLYPYVGGVGVYRQLCDDVASKDYEGFVTSAAS
ncbi:Predicted flavoprotein CzcO associated with the cation diffusion facilitator CzcD [Pseudonocardia ammonioxydans]|uniref:Predicted flavoprotein CzcO associated with the cation diffusion facilitator CzcD n=1 Tax=Pseudonocardia ammonioxydans TaxID=260086 RepID=A0A1I4XZ01_PSUAM|nr:NAD(P)/FAD-dependent oxidoreductase [Pseudonocardia ammonioxydans]SFN30460.1 Predicted flavoprotein CzcO associated with the cation diffusion facilitator CzcD [Pseudonocardia ammonioxydans]